MGAVIGIGLLGPVMLTVDGMPVDLGGDRQRLLLARLGLAVGRTVPVHELLELLWPAEPPDNAVGNVQSYVSRLRSRIGADKVVKDAAGYRLDVAADCIDAIRAERTLTGSRREPPTERARSLHEVLELWRGPSLGDVADNVVLMPAARRLDELRLRVVEGWAEAVLRAGDPASVVAVLEAEAAVDASRTGLHVLHVEALGRAGRTADALRAARAHRVALAEATGLDAGRRLDMLERRLLDGDLGPVDRPTVAADRRAPADGLFGRDDDLERLSSMARTPGLVSIVGTGGIGKTRLLLHLLDLVAPNRPTVLVRLGSLPPHGDVTGTVAEAVGLGPTPSPLAVAIAERLEPAAVLALDNAEHVLESVDALVRTIRSRRRDVSVLVTSRRRLGARDERLVELEPLDPHAGRELFVDRARRARHGFDATVDEAGIDTVLVATDGLPLSIELAAARERVLGVGGLAERLSSLGSPVGGTASTVAPPISLEAAVRWSHDLLDRPARALFTALCLVPGDFTIDLVEQLSEGDAVADLAELVDACLVQVDHDVPEPTFRILSLVRHGGAALLPGAGRAMVWRRLTDWVAGLLATAREDQDARRPGPNERLRRHRDLVEAVVEHAIASGAEELAARLAVTVAIMVTDDPDPRWLDWLARLGERSVGSTGRTGAWWVLAGATRSWIMGDVDGLPTALDTARRSLGGSPHDLAWYVEFVDVTSGVFAGDRGRADPAAEALAADDLAPDFIRATAVCSAALLCHYRGEVDDARRWILAHQDLLDRVAEVDGFVAFTRAELVATEDSGAALELLEAARRLCARSGQTYNRLVAEIATTAVLVRLGDSSAAATTATQVIDECRRAGMWPQVWIVVRLAAELLMAEQRAREAAVLLSAADADERSSPVTGPDAARVASLRERIAASLGAAGAAAATAHGASLRRVDAVTYAVEALAPLSRGSR